MIGIPTVILHVPDKRLFTMEEASVYLGKCENTIRKMVDRGVLQAKRSGRYRVFTLEVLDQYIETMPDWDGGEPPVPRSSLRLLRS